MQKKMFSFPKICRNIFQYLAAITGSMGILSSEMHFGWPSPALPVLTNGSYYFQISSEKASWLAVAIFPGIACGALLSSLLGNAFGRKRIILATAFPLFFSWLAIALARNDSFMFAGRFLGGVGGGLSFATVPMYLGEISEPQIRGILSSLCPVFVVMGILIINVLGIYLPIDVSAFVACPIPLLMFCIFWMMPESPVLLLSKNRKEEAQKSLITLRGSEEGKKEFLRLCFEDSIPEAKGCFLELFAVSVNRKALLIALGLRSVQQFSGSTAITFYCKTIFQENESYLSSNSATIIYFSLQALLSFISSLVVDTFGRKPMFIFSLAGTAITLFMAGACLLFKKHLFSYSYLLELSLFLNVSFFSLGVRTVPLLVMSEVFHPKIKPTALCFVTIYYAILAIFMTKFFHFLAETVNIACPVFIFGVLGLVSLVLYCVYVPETKGKTLEDIQKMLEGKERCIK